MALFRSADVLTFRCPLVAVRKSSNGSAVIFWISFSDSSSSASSGRSCSALSIETYSFHPVSPILHEHVMLNTFLSAVNLLFLIFVVFQLVYLLQGQGYLESRGVSYASYARQGFFQLLTVGALVFLLTWIVYRPTNMHALGPRLLNALLVGQTAIIIISALKRLWMYTQAYGFTLSRWWGIAGAILVGILLTMCFIGIVRKIHISSLMKWMTITSLFFISICLLPNNEGWVSRINTQRYLAGNMPEIDYGYLTTLSSDVYPTLADFSQRPWHFPRNANAKEKSTQLYIQLVLDL